MKNIDFRWREGWSGRGGGVGLGFKIQNINSIKQKLLDNKKRKKKSNNNSFSSS